jgi:hypothetical protein
MAFDLPKLLTDVFEPEPGEVVTVACDLPAHEQDDTPGWRERRLMAAEWQRAFAVLGEARGFTVNPLLTYRATGSNGADLPAVALREGREVSMEEVLLDSTLAAFLTEYSATAALDGFCERKKDFRAASMPGVEKRMERTALAADYREVARRCKILFDILRAAERLEVDFSTGHSCRFDLHHRHPEVDDGFLPRGKQGDRVINLPSGETFIVPYEGEVPGQPSSTEGHIPTRFGKDPVVFQIAGNRVTRVDGESTAARDMRSFFAADPARANIAEVAFGCNEWAIVTGNVLEDEKAGFHWAYGRSDHLGGTVGVDRFASPATVVHQDIVYARGNPIQVTRAAVIRGDSRTTVIRNSAYLVF